VVFVSDDSGDSWAVRDSGVSTLCCMRDLLLVATPNTEIVYLATDRGVYSYEHEGG
jgi:hypothetical protein